MKNKIKKYEYVSFDIFDTLIKRMVSNPHDIYSIVEKLYNDSEKEKISNFREKRIFAEKKCRLESEYEEVTLDEIYEYLNDYYSKETIKKLKRIEEKTEIDMCFFNKDIKNIYEWCINNNKTIIITSDMYLDENIIKQILKKNSIKYRHLFLSCSLRKTKNKGTIFDYIIEKMNINKNQVIHIGDNEKSDFYIPRKKGIDSILLKNNFKKTTSRNITKDIIENFSNNTFVESNDIFKKIGYKKFGPLLLCFSKWLKDEFEKNELYNIFFLSRDGYIMKKAFDLINDNINIKTKYFYASRRAIIVPSLKNCDSMKQVFESMHIKNEVSLKTLLKKVGLDDDKYNNDYFKKYNLNINDNVNYNMLLNDKKYENLLSDLLECIKTNSVIEYGSFIKYKNRMNFKGKVAIVDIGWFGNMQNALENLNLDLDIHGYYIGIEPRKNYQNKYKMNGFLFDSYKNYDVFLKEHNFNAIFEMLFLGQHGSVKRYNYNENDGVEFYEYEYKDYSEKNNIMKIQENALLFVDTFYKLGLFNYLYDDMSVIFDLLCSTFLNPTIEEAIVFGNFKFLDDEEKYIAKPLKLQKYLNIKRFIKDYKNSYWRIGFLKRIFKIKLPYFKINMAIREKYLKEKEKNE